MENVTEKEFEFKPAYNLTKFCGDFVLSFNIEFGDDLDKILSGHIKTGGKIPPIAFDFFKQLQMTLDCKGRGQLVYYNTMFNLTKFYDIFVLSFKARLADEIDVLFRDILAVQEVPQVAYSFVRKLQDHLGFARNRFASQQSKDTQALYG